MLNDWLQYGDTELVNTARLSTYARRMVRACKDCDDIGDVIPYVDGSGGPRSDVELVDNPSLEVNSAGWYTHNTGVTAADWSRSTVWAQDGTHSMHQAGTSSAPLLPNGLRGFIGSYYLPKSGAPGYRVQPGRTYKHVSWVNVIARPTTPGDAGLWQEVFWFDSALAPLPVPNNQSNGETINLPVALGVQRLEQTVVAPEGAYYAQTLTVMGTRIAAVPMEFYTDSVSFTAEVSGDYTNPVADNAPWMSGNDDGADFMGLMINEITGLSGSSKTLQVTEKIVAGGVPVGGRVASRTMAVTATGFASSDAGMEAGIEWLTAALTDPCGGADCSGPEMRMLSSCASPCDSMPDNSVEPVTEWIPMNSLTWNLQTGDTISEVAGFTNFTNFASNPSSESGPAGNQWTASGGPAPTVVFVGAGLADQRGSVTRWAPTSNLYSLTQQIVGAIAGRQYKARLSVKSTNPRQAFFAVAYTNSGGIEISERYWSNVTMTTPGAYIDLRAEMGTAPAGTAGVKITFGFLTDMVAGETHDIDAVMVTERANPLDYFDGNSPNNQTAGTMEQLGVITGAGFYGWLTLSSTTLAYDNTVSRSGVGSLKLTSTGADADAFWADPTIGTSASSMRVSEGISYRLRGWIRSATISRSAVATINWYNSAGGWLGGSSSPGILTILGQWKQFEVTAEAPANAVQAILQFTVNGTAVAEVHHLDDVQFAPTTDYTYTAQWAILGSADGIPSYAYLNALRWIPSAIGKVLAPKRWFPPSRGRTVLDWTIRYLSQRTNLIANPSFEVNTAGYAVGGSVPPTFVRSTARFFDRTASGLLTWGTGGTFPLVQYSVVGLIPGQTYTASAYAYVPTGSVSLNLVCGGIIGGAMSTKDAWTRFSVTFTAITTTHAIQIWPTTAATAGMTAYIDAVLLETGSALLPYFDGATADTAATDYVWTGTADASTSTATMQPASGQTVSVTPQVVSEDGEIISGGARVVQVGQYPVHVYQYLDATPGCPDEWQPQLVAGTANVAIEVELSVTQQPTLSTEECLLPYVRQLNSVVVIDGPRETQRTVLGKGRAIMSTFEWTFVATDPYIYRDPVRLFAGPVSGPATELGGGAEQQSTAAVSPLYTSACPAPSSNLALNCADNPNCSPIVAPPSVPVITGDCEPTYSAMYRQQVNVDGSAIGPSDAALQISFTNTGTQTGTHARVRVYQADDLPTADECTFIAEGYFDYVAPGATAIMRFDGGMEVECSDGSVVDGSRVIRGTYRGPYLPIGVGCSKPLIVCLDTEIDDLDDVLGNWTLDLVRRLG